MVQKRDSGFSAIPLCLHSGCMSGSHVAELILKFLYNTSAGKSLLEIVYNRFRSFRFFFLSIIPLFFFRRAALIVMSALRRPALSSLRLCVRFACGGVATGIPLQHERRKITSGNRIQPISISSPFSPSPILFCVARRARFYLRRASRVSFSVMLRDWAFLFHHFTPSQFFLAVCEPVCLYRFA